jgi:integrase
MQSHNCSLVTPTASLEELILKAKAFVVSAKAPATLNAYRSDWRDFEAWCRMRHLQALPASPQTVALYITDRASTLASGTITRRLTSITKAHQSSGFTNSPASTRHFVVGETLKGIRRTIGTAQKGKSPLLADDIRRILSATTEGPQGLRDRALFLVGFAGAFRRSELARINVCDLSFTKDGVVIDVHISKTDQEGAGRKVGLPFGQNPDTCPVMAIRSWLSEAQISEGPLFRKVGRHGHPSKRGLNRDSIGVILKLAAARAGMSPETIENLGAHSLRAGHVTQATVSGVSERVIMRQTGHKSTATLRRYIASAICSARTPHADWGSEEAAAGTAQLARPVVSAVHMAPSPEKNHFSDLRKHLNRGGNSLEVVAQTRGYKTRRNHLYNRNSRENR